MLGKLYVYDEYHGKNDMWKKKKHGIMVLGIQKVVLGIHKMVLGIRKMLLGIQKMLLGIQQIFLVFKELFLVFIICANPKI